MSANSNIKHRHVFLTALAFFTRIPIPKNTPFSPEHLNRAAAFFPFIGWIVGGFSAVFYLLAARVLPGDLAVGLAIAGGVLLTGAFHEDGFADMCDGFGGAWERDRILEIMKDSRLGTYGALGLGLLMFVKWLSLCRLPSEWTPFAFFAGHALSRLASTSLIRFSNYAKANEDSKAKPLATRMSNGAFLFACLCGLAPLGLTPTPLLILSLIPVSVATLYLMRFFHKWIQGYTGDCLGSVQQVTEVTFYIFLLGIAGI